MSSNWVLCNIQNNLAVKLITSLRLFGEVIIAISVFNHCLFVLSYILYSRRLCLFCITSIVSPFFQCIEAEGDIVGNLDTFVLEPACQKVHYKCRITRDRKGVDGGFYPVYYLHLERDYGKKVKAKLNYFLSKKLSTSEAVPGEDIEVWGTCTQLTPLK